ncbi:DUF7380 domain-containing protein [Salinarimonas ramus]|uniref:DUF7380 domain-containing protein n=1 Tax=Salinarimonas ramus TaxID=690164 RepID=A0A917V3K1_9HYPH|nr:hypothetical protein [Salinarimonas ramus]GGK34831.1 hypothetical protein GCM10011322_22000 [Salinarimonas ramus]
MTEREAEWSVAPDGEGTQIPIWLRATLEDICDLEFEGPIEGCNSADCCDLSTAYRKAADLHEKLGNEAAAPAARVFAMLADVTSFHFKPNEKNAPFGPMMVSESGRSAIPADFRGQPVETLANAALRASNPVLKARLSDTCWLLERKRQGLGRAAVEAYAGIVEGIDARRLKDRLERSDPVLGLATRDALRRALTIGRAVGWNNDEVATCRDWVIAIRERALKDGNPVPVHWFFEMDLDFNISAPEDLAAEIEQFLTSRNDFANPHIVVELWRLAVRAYHIAKDDNGKYRCRTAAAEALVTEAEGHNSAMLASHWLSQAIAEYHGVPGKRDRRTELRHKLVNVQSGIAEEMSSFSYPIDLKDAVERTEKLLGEQQELIDVLLMFARLGRSPDPDKLMADAIKSIREHPLSSLFGASFHDHEGKVIHKTEGGGFQDNNNGDALRVQISRQEGIRRHVYAIGTMEPARQHIMGRFYINDDTFHVLLQGSPFVPSDRLATFSRGFTRFFEGDFASALYILTPMLENSLRHVLKMSGNDVTSFDDAQQVQEDRSISVLFDQMRPELEATFGKAITADIDNVFLSKPGPTIRHALSHGRLNDDSPFSGDAIYACWLIFRLCCIPLIAHRGQIRLPT